MNPGTKWEWGVEAALTLSFWKEWRKFPPSSPSSRGVPGGLLMPLMLLGEFWREEREGEPRRPSNLPTRWGDRLSGASGLGQGGCCQGGNRIHSLLEVHLCHLTLEGRKARIQFLVCSSVERPPNPPKSHITSVQRIFCSGWTSGDLPTSPAKAGGGDQAWLSRRRLLGQDWAGCSVTTGPAPAYLTIHSCGGAPCRPCLPSGRPSLDPSGTEGEAQGMVAEWAPGPLQCSHAPAPSCKKAVPSGSIHSGGAPLSGPSARHMEVLVGAGPSPRPSELWRAEVLSPTHQMRKQTQRGKDAGAEATQWHTGTAL